MPDSGREITATRIAVMELKDERQLVREGYELLDEKRLLLAGEIQRQLAHLDVLRRECAELSTDLHSRVFAALQRHGLDELSVYPPPLMLSAEHLVTRRSRLFGLELLEVHLEPTAQAPGPLEHPVNPTPEARACAEVQHKWLRRAVELAACSVNLRRLVRDYVRTERRARAIENVLMPDIESAIKIIEEQLEEMDQEEIARLRQRRPSPA
ncbi:MAG TPA: V-type ATP synthase subunit D [Steroidobacteraceae bacterium]|nr:V-type ATP synthase subunit D [Steroidobacteraceae bacterium]